MNTVSVIIPVYNTEEYITECIKSLKEQTYTDIEIVLVNDGSSETCTNLLETLALQDSRIKLFHLEHRQGVGAARNVGIKKATGKYIYFLDSDDYLAQETLALLVKYIKDASLVRGRMYTTNSSTSFAIIFDGINQTKTYDVDKYNLLKNKSAQNFLVRKDFIAKHNLSFAEDVDRYSDLAFMVPALIHVEQFLYVKEAIYFRRKRYDPITNPSLSQGKVEEKIKDFVYMYNTLKEGYQDELANKFLDNQLLNFYRKSIVGYIRKTRNTNFVFENLSQTMSKVSHCCSNDFFFKREVQALSQGSESQYKRVMNRHNFLRDLRGGLKSKRKFYSFLYHNFLQKLKKNKKLVIFESFQGRSYSDSPQYIYEYMLENNMNYKFVWSVNEKQDIPGNPKQVKRLSFMYFYYLARCKYWILNSRLPNYIKKDEKTIYLQTWHGTPLKRLAGDMEDVHMPGTNSERYKLNFYNETQKWDYLIAPNQYSKDIFERAFWFEKDMLEVGYPRNDLLYNKNSLENINQLKTKMNIPMDKKVLLYAPTWRDDEYYSKGNYRFNLKLDLEKMMQEFGDEYIILLRMHYFIASQLDISAYKGFVYDFSSYNDVGELYLVSDLLMTDYSSVFFDYANLKRPILFYTYDLEKYRHSLRGFYIDIEKDLPGPLLMDTDEVIESIKHIDHLTENYQERYKVFYNRFCSWDNGNASKKTVEKVFK